MRDERQFVRDEREFVRDERQVREGLEAVLEGLWRESREANFRATVIDSLVVMEE